jgi:hypothetical protein
MTPEARREKSNRLLTKHGLPVAESLPLIEEDAAVSLRSAEEVLRRLVGLWAVAGAAHLPKETFFRDYIKSNDLTAWLSKSESDFLFAAKPSEQARIHYGWQTEPMYFLAWCAGLIPTIKLPFDQSTVESVLPLFPEPGSESLERLRKKITLQSKAELMDWADLLYRTHWAVRDAQIHGRSAPGGLVSGAVMEWHKAVNWMTCYDSEDDWDHVATDT